MKLSVSTALTVLTEASVMSAKTVSFGLKVSCSPNHVKCTYAVNISVLAI